MSWLRKLFGGQDLTASLDREFKEFLGAHQGLDFEVTKVEIDPMECDATLKLRPKRIPENQERTLSYIKAKVSSQ